MNVKTLKAFTMRDSTTGELTSFAYGTVYAVNSTLGNALIADGLAEEYTGDVIIAQPYGMKQITANGTYDVTVYSSVTVNAETVTITYDANGGTGTVASETVVAGDSVTLSDGTGLTAPTGKEFAGWATEATAEEPDVASPFTVTESLTLHAVYVAET